MKTPQITYSNSQVHTAHTKTTIKTMGVVLGVVLGVASPQIPEKNRQDAFASLEDLKLLKKIIMVKNLCITIDVTIQQFMIVQFFV